MNTKNKVITLQVFVIEGILSGEKLTRPCLLPLLFQLLFVGLETMSPSIHLNDNTARKREAHW